MKRFYMLNSTIEQNEEQQDYIPQPLSEELKRYISLTDKLVDYARKVPQLKNSDIQIYTYNIKKELERLQADLKEGLSPSKSPLTSQEINELERLILMRQSLRQLEDNLESF